MGSTVVPQEIINSIMLRVVFSHLQNNRFAEACKLVVLNVSFMKYFYSKCIGDNGSEKPVCVCVYHTSEMFNMASTFTKIWYSYADSCSYVNLCINIHCRNPHDINYLGDLFPLAYPSISFSTRPYRVHGRNGYFTFTSMNKGPRFCDNIWVERYESDGVGHTIFTNSELVVFEIQSWSSVNETPETMIVPTVFFGKLLDLVRHSFSPGCRFFLSKGSEDNLNIDLVEV